jgi:glycosyltransferase involved in cell wall biosynthesis
MPAMRILLWHGWLLEGSGSNVLTAKVAEVWKRQGHDVMIVCQEPHPERFGFERLRAEDVRPVLDGGRVTVARPDIGSLLPAFVVDEYEGFRVKPFVDLTDDELGTYLEQNVRELRRLTKAWKPDVVVAGHAVPGPVVARRAVGDGAYIAKVHGSDLEYAVRLQDRYAELAREGLAGARAVVGASHDVVERTRAVTGLPAEHFRLVPPGVDVDRWRPLPRAEALRDVASRLGDNSSVSRGRPAELDGDVRAALEDRDAERLTALARTYDQGVPDPDAGRRLAALANDQQPLVGYFGKLIPQKGVERLIEAAVLLGNRVRAIVVGFGQFREWLTALVLALDAGDVDAYAWLRETSPMQLELEPDEVRAAAGFADRVTFTGRLDHRYAPEAVAAADAVAVPSILDEAFGMVAAEIAAAGTLPVVARHSGLAEVAAALEKAIGRPGALSFEPGPGATRRLAERLGALLDEPAAARERLAAAARAHVAKEWTWERTAERLLDAAS